MKLLQGDCLEVMRATGPDNSVTAIVTDPPYALEFMGKGWDKVLPSVEIWKEALRVLKPGGIALVFGGTRTYHRLTCSLEDAGFEIRDCMMWLYGSGFPKSLDVSKAIDKAAGAEREVVGERSYAGGHVQRSKAPRFKGDKYAGGQVYQENEVRAETAPATPAAQLWQGYGTALKPAWEPIVIAMKPLDGTFAQNALEHGVAGINVDGCRVGDGEGGTKPEYVANDKNAVYGKAMGGGAWKNVNGRWPANLILDETVAAQLGDKARYFYTAKASKKDRGEGNNHPTVKPTALMRYLVRMVTMPEGTIILDPFMGSGSTGVACKAEGVDFIGIERDAEYLEIARGRITV